jgi:hypothetical protein
MGNAPASAVAPLRSAAEAGRQRCALDAPRAPGLDACQPQRQGPPKQWRLLRNCRLRPAELLAWCCAPGLLALLVAVPFLLQGYTWIAAFALLQLPCLVLAVLSCGVHARDGELISITGGRLRLEQRRGWRVQSHEWPLHSVRLLPTDPDVPAPERCATRGRAPPAGPCLVLAGAGSGKTRVIVHKIARLLASAGWSRRQIAAITFTNKAAAEMRERAKALVGPRAAREMAISTFHSLGVRMLRSDGERIGLKPNFSILDSDDVLGVLRDAGGTTDAALARRWQWAISLWKNQGLDADAAERAAADDDEQVAARVMRRYQERLAAYQAVDFDDLIGLPLASCCSATPRCARRLAAAASATCWSTRYQDTNAVQYELLKLLVGERGIFTAVGDDDQSIYGWRGATIDNLQAPAAGLPAAEGHRAGAELPLHRPHPARRQQR